MDRAWCLEREAWLQEIIEWQVQNCCVSEIRWLSLPKMLSGGNAIEISDPRRHRLDIQKRRLFSSRINEWYRRI
jgi:hypothetical protein